MKKKTHPHESPIGALLYEADYRHDGYQWRIEYDSHGCGLTASEQEINRTGGRKCGRSSAELLKTELCDREVWLCGTDPESHEYVFWSDWYQRAKAALADTRR